MRRYLLDSNALNALANGHVSLVQNAKISRRRGDVIGTCEPVVAEVYYGLMMSSSRVLSTEYIESTLRKVTTWSLSRAASREYGRIAADLKRRGRPMQIIDMMVAAIALMLANCTVVTTDSDFAAITGLDVIDWTLPPSEPQS